MFNFGNVDIEIPLPNSAAQVLSPVCTSVECSKRKTKKRQLRQCHCRNRGKKRKFFFGNCGNGIAENGKKKKKSGFEISGRVKKSIMSTIFLQHFHNKSHVISYY